jgi:adenylyltransferase/sulfurtransferase
MTFHKEEFLHYSRQMLLSDWGIEAQQQLKNGRVLVVGAGGLGCPLLQYLAAAGVGQIGIVDGDRVGATNLHRQILFGKDAIGKLKVEVAQQQLQNVNPYIEINIFDAFITTKNAFQLIENYDIVADCTDNFEARYVISETCEQLKKWHVWAAIAGFEGQISVFGEQVTEGGILEKLYYHQLFPKPTKDILNCAESGVLGATAGIIGTLQANEILKILANVGENLWGKFLVFNALTLKNKIFKLHKYIDKNTL